MSAILTEPRFFPAVAHRIRSANRVETLIELPFGITYRRSFTLNDLRFSASELSEEQYRRSQHALVVLIGGKRIVVEPDVLMREQWNECPNLGARVYLAERIHGRPVGLTEGILSSPVLDVSAFYSWLAERNFDLGEVKRVLNGKGGGRG